MFKIFGEVGRLKLEDHGRRHHTCFSDTVLYPHNKRQGQLLWYMWQLDCHRSNQPKNSPKRFSILSDLWVMRISWLVKDTWFSFEEGMEWLWLNIHIINSAKAQEKGRYCTNDWGVVWGTICGSFTKKGKWTRWFFGLWGGKGGGGGVEVVDLGWDGRREHII